MARVLRTALTAALAAGALLLAPPALAGDARDVPLVDQTGAPFTLRAFQGAPVAVTFVASRCTDTCPIANAVFARVAQQLGRARTTARLVSVTIDPAYDTPIVMANLARQFAARPPRWRMASGTPRNIERVLGAFGVVHEGMEVHGTFVYVLDRSGRLARTLPLSTNSAGEIDAALAALR